MSAGKSGIRISISSPVFCYTYSFARQLAIQAHSSGLNTQHPPIFKTPPQYRYVLSRLDNCDARFITLKRQFIHKETLVQDE
jgi:hypothetical protein